MSQRIAACGAGAYGLSMRAAGWETRGKCFAMLEIMLQYYNQCAGKQCHYATSLSVPVRGLFSVFMVWHILGAYFLVLHAVSMATVGCKMCDGGVRGSPPVTLTSALQMNPMQSPPPISPHKQRPG